MKRFCKILLLTVLTVFVFDLQTADAKQLRILGIGNSFTDDSMMYLPDMLADAGIEGVVLGRLYYGGCSLERHCEFYDKGSDVYQYYKSTDNSWVTVDDKATVNRAITDEPWDIVVLQQSSPLSGLWESYRPYLDRLIEIVHACCPNPDVEIVWNMTWAYSRDSKHEPFVNYDHDQKKMYDTTFECAAKVVESTEIERVIPSGVVIQALRATPLNDSHLELTRDSYHLDNGIGRYAVACCWFEKLIKPVYGVSIVGNGFRAECKTSAVTDLNCRTIQKSARKACRKRF